MTFASTSLVFDPVWPWSLPVLGQPLLWGAVLLVAALTVLTYLVGRRGSWGRFWAVLAVRLAALLVVFLLMLRPSLATYQDTVTPSKLLLLLDASQSMEFTDELNNQSRWQAALQLLSSDPVKEALARLQRRQRVEVVYYQGGGTGVARFDPQADPDGERTPLGLWLQQTLRDHEREEHLRGLWLLSDGADNGTDLSPVPLAKAWRATGAPLNTFGLGSPTTTPKQRDIFFIADRIAVDPPLPVPVKTNFKVKAVLDAPGFEYSRVNVQAFFEGEKVASKIFTLEKTSGNEIDMELEAPDTPGEYKLTLKVTDTPAGEVSLANNEVSTYFTATGEGLRVLWVEGKKRFWEPRFVIDALQKDRRFRVFYTERVKEKGPAQAREDWFNFDKVHYDVIVIGDISAGRFSGGDPKVFEKIARMVKDKGTGLVMLGGYETFANSDWQDHPAIADLLPVQPDEPGQVNVPVRVEPVEERIPEYAFLRLAEEPKENERLWYLVFRDLDGVTPLGTVRPGATVLATANGKPVLAAVARAGEKGRVVAFGGDTTWKAWRHSPDALPAFDRFWQRLLLWAAGQDKAEGNVYVHLDSRRLPAASGGRVGFTVGLQSKTGLPIQGGEFTVKVKAPGGQEWEVNTFPEEGRQRGYIWQASAPGEYTVEVTGAGKDAEGNKIDGRSSARFLVYAEDLENLKPAADHDLLRRLAAAGGGKFRLASETEFLAALQELELQATDEGQSRPDLYPDWDSSPASEAVGDHLAALLQSGMPLYILFSGLLCLEWFLRRRWGMV